MAGKRLKRAAYSLIELIVSTFVVSLLLASVAIALVYCNQYMRTCETKAQAQDQALTAAVWMSRYLQDANITAMVASGVPDTSAPGISFASVRDPYNTSVTFANGTGGAITWPQTICVCLVPDPMDSTANVIKEISIPNTPAPYDPPTPSTGLPDLATASGSNSPLTRILAHNIRALQIEIYGNIPSTGPPYIDTTAPSTTNAAGQLIYPSNNTVNITVEAYAPYYGFNYGVNVSTSVRPQN